MEYSCKNFAVRKEKLNVSDKGGDGPLVCPYFSSGHVASRCGRASGHIPKKLMKTHLFINIRDLLYLNHKGHFNSIGSLPLEAKFPDSTLNNIHGLPVC